MLEFTCESYSLSNVSTVEFTETALALSGKKTFLIAFYCTETVVQIIEIYRISYLRIHGSLANTRQILNYTIYLLNKVGLLLNELCLEFCLRYLIFRLIFDFLK